MKQKTYVSNCRARVLNQLLCDSDLVRMGHSLEFRTNLVDVRLPETFSPNVSDFEGGVGEVMLAKSPEKSFPEFIINSLKSIFSIQMGQSLTQATNQQASGDLAAPETPLTWCWARVVIEGISACE
jgi:hypothetical protein